MIRAVYELYIFIRNLVFDGFTTVCSTHNQSTSQKKNVLIVRLDAIGDFVLWLDAATELRKLYPAEHFRLVLIGNCIWTELAKKQHIFDEVIPLDRILFYYDLPYRMNIWRLLRNTKWNVAIQPTYSRDFLFGDSVIRVSGAVEMIGSIGDLSNQPKWQKQISDSWYTTLIPACDVTIMELERNAEFIRGLGSSSFHAGLPCLEFCEGLPVDLLNKDYFVLVPGASLALRQWPVVRFAVLAGFIKATYGYSVVICGTHNEMEQGACLKQLLQDDALDYTGKTSLNEYVSIIKGGLFLIGNESSAVHIATAIGVKAFCLMGGRHFGRFLPYTLECDSIAGRPLPVAISHQMDCFMCNNTCIYAAQNDCYPAPCLEQISVEEVLNEITLFLSKSGC